jgi:hypothetical protein
MMDVASGFRSAPPRLFEYGYYCLVVYAILGPALGVSVEFLGVGILGVMAALCIVSLGSRATVVYAPIVYPIACAISFVALQVFFHDESLLAEYVRPFFTWILTLIVIQSLVQHQRFLHRFAVVAFMIGLALLPYLRMDYTNTSQLARAGLDRTVGLANPNDFAAWFGFCALYFAIVGIETRRVVARVASWFVTVGCLYLVSLTVSRGTLFAFAVAIIVALRRSLKRSFLPLLSICILGWVLYMSGIFEQAVASYTARATAETGRFLVWPLAIERFLEVPLLGVGVSNLDTYISTHNRSITPHNSFLFVALASGVVPLLFYALYWWRAAWGAWRTQGVGSAEAAFCIPLLLYTFLLTLEGNLSFMKPWAVVVLALALAGNASHRAHTVVVRRRRQREVARSRSL